ncbi:hypothetical protein B0O99DRAFT_661354 [Bisporella sp. PMI_857]|nr:hypothetical protein B0O99DRAFT_661354 [Bisporella sp. PMI_857]
MSATDFTEEAGRRDYKAPYSRNHPIPTIQKYREHRGELDEQQRQAESAQHSDEDESKKKRAFESVKTIFKDEDKKKVAGNPYPTANRNTEAVDSGPGEHDSSIPGPPLKGEGRNGADNSEGGETVGSSAYSDDKPKDKKGNRDQTVAEKVAGMVDPKEKRKAMKHNERSDGGRVVTDPVTHLPLVIRDSTEKDMRRTPENEPAPGSSSRTATGISGASKSRAKLDAESEETQQSYNGMQKVFPSPSFDDIKAELFRTFQLALCIAIASITVLATLVVISIIILGSNFHVDISKTHSRWDQQTRLFIPLCVTIILAGGFGFGLILSIRGWLGKKVERIWEDEVWDAARVDEQKTNDTEDKLPESVAWMNGILASVWPLINPELFASVVDMLEDVMQASLPKIIKMVSVDDLGQGSEAIRILGIRWLPTGAASQTVDEDGNLQEASNNNTNDRAVPGQGEEDKQDDDADGDQPSEEKKENQENKQKEHESQAMREGMEAEQGDFVNLELAFSYRARSSGKSIKSKAKNAHLYLKFYLPGGMFVPVWVELRGIIGTMRVRLQLTPDPPFFSLCTLTFLGQPRADLSCVPLSKHLPNLMDVPLISSFVQSSIDAALAEYVAPKSLTLDLKDVLVGDDFKKDTVACGVIRIFIRSAKDFKEGDGRIGPLSGSSDSYVTCSWGKFGKTVSSTRIIEDEQIPVWNEWAYIPVTPEELNAEEKLRVQLWDSDKHTADDDLGRVEVDLKELMNSPATKNRMAEREDRFKGQDPDENMPGTLSWAVGYFAKNRITDEQLANQTEDTSIRTREELKKHVCETAEKKLREATAHDERKEIEQQKVQDYKEHEDALICASPPDSTYPSGILSIQIHNITGLEVEKLQKRDRHNKNDGGDREDEAEQSDDLPSSYCTIILNHKKIFMTRTKPKNAKPFFNTGTERFIRNWNTAEIMVSVRDSKEGENDALLGIVWLPLARVFEKRSQVENTYRLVGGIGFGRARISLVFRSVELKLPKELLGWEYGTLEIKAPAQIKGSAPDLQNHRIKFRTNLSHAKMVPDNGQWRPEHDRESLFLPCRNRYSAPLILEFRKSSLGPDSTTAFAVFWISEIPDDEEQTFPIKVWKGENNNIKRASACGEYKGLDNDEQPIAEIEIKLKFWRGLSGYHKSYAQKEKSGNMRDVMEVLDTANDETGRGDSDGEYADASEDSTGSEDQSRSHSGKPNKLKSGTNDTDSSSSDDDEHEATNNPIKMVKQKAHDLVEKRQASDDGSRGAIAQQLNES